MTSQMTAPDTHTLLFPCAGRSTRYPGLPPKWMLTTPSGELAIQKAVDSVRGEGSRRIFAIRSAHDREFGAADVLRRAFDGDVEILVLEEDTTGPAHTVAEMITRSGVTGPIAIKDADSFFEPIDYPAQSFIACTDLRTHLDISRVGAKSFVSINENGLIIDVVEKDVCTNYISSGLYGFRDSQLFLRTYHRGRLALDGEIFVSHVAKLLLLEGEVFEPVFVDKLVDVGTKTDWLVYTARSSTYVVDIDGIVIKSQRAFLPPLWGEDPLYLNGNVAALRRLQAQGAQLVFLTTRPSERRDEVEALLDAAGLRPLALVMGCHNGRRGLINEYARDNPYPSAIALNIRRDSDELEAHLGE